MNPVNKILLGIGAAAGLIIAVVIVWLSLANAHLKTELAQTEANNTACHLANDEFVTQVAIQNKAVDLLKTQSLAREKRAQAAARQTEKEAHSYFLLAAEMAKNKKQGDACHAAQALFDRYWASAK